MFTLIFIATALAQVPKYGDCNKDNFQYKSVAGKGFPLVPQLAGGPIKISGEVYLIDGCTFGVRNFVFYNARQSKFFGGNKGTANGITLSDDVVNPSANPAEQKFTLVTRAGAQANFDSLNEIRLFETETNTLLAVASLGDAPTSTTGGGANTTPKSVALKPEYSFGVMSAILLAFFL